MTTRFLHLLLCHVLVPSETTDEYLTISYKTGIVSLPTGANCDFFLSYKSTENLWSEVTIYHSNDLYFYTQDGWNYFNLEKNIEFENIFILFKKKKKKNFLKKVHFL